MLGIPSESFSKKAFSNETQWKKRNYSLFFERFGKFIPPTYASFKNDPLKNSITVQKGTLVLVRSNLKMKVSGVLLITFSKTDNILPPICDHFNMK